MQPDTWEEQRNTEIASFSLEVIPCLSLERIRRYFTDWAELLLKRSSRTFPCFTSVVC
jgi:hypothetical protein